MQLDEYRSALERFHEAFHRERYLHFSGLKETFDLRRIFSEHSDLFRIEAVREIEAELERVPEHLEGRRKGLRKLRAFAIERRFASAVSPLDQEIAELESGHTVVWDDANVPCLRLPALLAAEPDAARRRRLAELRMDALARSNPLRRERHRILHAEAKALGFRSTLDAYRSASGVDYERLAAMAGRILDATRDDYLERLGRSLELRAGVRLSEAERCDLEYWSRTGDFDAFFPREELAAKIEDTFAGLGIDLDAQPGLALDLEVRARKRPQAFCAPVRVPAEIKVVLLPRGGPDDYRSLLGEVGRAEHFLWTGGQLAAEQRLVGDRALGESFGFLFEDLVRDGVWLLDAMSAEREGEYLRLVALQRAWRVRRSAAKLGFELRLEAGEAMENPGKEYAEILRDGTGVRHDREEYLEDHEDGLAAADRLRAWIFVAQWRDRLRAKFGAAWFRSRSVAKLLKEIWETGQLYGVDELSRELGLGPLDEAALLDELLEGLRR
ncbi:MAG: hypothetical protein DMG07_17745 [Acidobacteria bacterium]|nr:MAG: hypothetical protein DMG07_17745 [Acidobacteriota bacterium]